MIINLQFLMYDSNQLQTIDTGQKSKRLRVLISAYACEPDRGSEPGVGWNLSVSVAEHHDVWVITRANNRGVIEAEMKTKPVAGLNFIYYDLPKWACWWKKGGRGVQLYYTLWQLGLWRVCRDAHKRIGFDVVHHLTFGKYWVPSMLSFLPIPFVWGPVGGGESMPRTFWKGLIPAEFIFEACRSVARRLGELNPLVRRTARKSAIALATTAETSARLRRLGCPVVQEFPQCALNDDQVRLLTAEQDDIRDGVVRFLSIGRALHWKGFSLGLRAFAQAVVPESEYWLLVNGSGRAPLEQLAKELGVYEQVRFIDKVGSLEEVYRIISTCDVLVHPALHEAFGNVVQEALAAGKPVICLDRGGPATQVHSEFGFCADSRTPEDAIFSIQHAMSALMEDSGLRSQMGVAARAHVIENMRWNILAKKLSDKYLEVARGPDEAMAYQE